MRLEAGSLHLGAHQVERPLDRRWVVGGRVQHRGFETLVIEGGEGECMNVVVRIE